MRDPDAVGGAHDRLQCRDHAAGGRDTLDAPVRHSVLVGLTVGDDQEPMIVQTVLDEVLQCLLVPHRCTLTAITRGTWAVRRRDAYAKIQTSRNRAEPVEYGSRPNTSRIGMRTWVSCNVLCQRSRRQHSQRVLSAPRPRVILRVASSKLGLFLRIRSANSSSIQTV